MKLFKKYRTWLYHVYNKPVWLLYMLVSGIWVFCIFGIYFSIVSPLYHWTQWYEKQTQHMQHLFVQFAQKEKSSIDINSKNNQLEQKNNQLLITKTIDERLLEFFNICDHLGIKIESFHPEQSANKETYQKNGFNIVTSITFEQILTLFSALNQAQLFLQCKELNITTVGDAQMLKVCMNLEAIHFIKKDQTPCKKN